MAELDVDICLELITELVRDEGEVVFKNDWDSGGPGAGADSERVYRYKHLYWPDNSTEGLSGPCESLEDALKGDCGAVTNATTSIRCSELDSAELSSLLWVQSCPKEPFKINGERWFVDANRTLMKVATA